MGTKSEFLLCVAGGEASACFTLLSQHALVSFFFAPPLDFCSSLLLYEMLLCGSPLLIGFKCGKKGGSLLQS